jgi:hypothetical protein
VTELLDLNTFSECSGGACKIERTFPFATLAHHNAWFRLGKVSILRCHRFAKDFDALRPRASKNWFRGIATEVYAWRILMLHIFCFVFLRVRAKLKVGSKSIQQDFQLLIQALEELVLEVKTTELYQPRHKYREI